MIQTLCPYSVSPLASGQSNDEHILPFALGAPASFTVQALASENSRMNKLIDAPAANDQLLRFLAMAQGVSSRSGPLKAVVPGVVAGTNDAIEAQFSYGGLKLKFVKPIETDGHGRVTSVRGFGADARSKANQVAANYAKKGIPLEWDSERTVVRPKLNLGLTTDFTLIQRQTFKIAYLTTVRIFGDQAITGLSGQQFRDAIMAETDDALALTKLRVRINHRLPQIVARSSGHHEHAITCVLISDVGLMTAVDLFGSFTLLSISSGQGIIAPELTGEVIRIAAGDATLSSRTYLESFEELMQAKDFRG